jgi:hypothetical protein
MDGKANLTGASMHSLDGISIAFEPHRRSDKYPPDEWRQQQMRGLPFAISKLNHPLIFL